MEKKIIKVYYTIGIVCVSHHLSLTKPGQNTIHVFTTDRNFCPSIHHNSLFVLVIVSGGSAVRCCCKFDKFG